MIGLKERKRPEDTRNNRKKLDGKYEGLNIVMREQ